MGGQVDWTSNVFEIKLFEIFEIVLRCIQVKNKNCRKNVKKKMKFFKYSVIDKKMFMT